jgi:hypothetical protein
MEDTMSRLQSYTLRFFTLIISLVVSVALRAQAEWPVDNEQPFTAAAPQVFSVAQLAGNQTACISITAAPLQPPLLAPGVAESFQGPDDSTVVTRNGFSFQPADPNIAVGPNHIVVVMNGLVAIYSLTGACLYHVSLQNWFSNSYPGCGTPPPPTCFPATDPRIMYDPAENHWVMVAVTKDLGFQTSAILLAVSESSDPTGNWWTYALNGNLHWGGGDSWPDQPDIGFDNILSSQGGAIYLTTDQYFFANGQPQTASLLLMPKSSLYIGQGFTCWQAWNPLNPDPPGGKAYSLRPAKMYGTGDPQNPIEYMINTKREGGDSFVAVWQIVPTFWPTDLNWTLTSPTTQIGTYLNVDDAMQPAACGTNTLDVKDVRLKNAMWQNNYLYGAFAGKTLTSQTVARVRYFAIDTRDFTLHTNKSLFSSTVAYFCPAISADTSGNIFLVHSASSGVDYGGTWFTGQTTSDSGPEPPALLQAGRVCEVGMPAPWGDYLGSAPDPSNGASIWVTGTFAKNVNLPSGGKNWGTWNGLLTFGADFSVQAKPTSLTINRASQGTAIISITSLNSFSAAVTLSCAQLPANVTCGFSPNPVTPPSNGNITSTLTITVGAPATPGVYTIQTLGNAAALTRGVSISLTIAP